jgi:FtsZ-binding cell division protein ZapB
MHIIETIREVFTPDELAAIAAAKKRISDAADLISAYQSETSAKNQGKQSPLLLAMYEAVESFAANPTAKAAEAVSNASIKLHCAERIESALMSAHAQVKSKVSIEIGNLLEVVFDRAVETMEKSHADVQKALDSNDSLRDEARSFKLKCETAIQNANQILKQMRQDYLAFLNMEIAI